MNNNKKYIVEVRVPAEHVYHVFVEAENQYEAKRKVQNLSIADICSKSEYDTETDWTQAKYFDGEELKCEFCDKGATTKELDPYMAQVYGKEEYVYACDNHTIELNDLIYEYSRNV